MHVGALAIASIRSRNPFAGVAPIRRCRRGRSRCLGATGEHRTPRLGGERDGLDYRLDESGRIARLVRRECACYSARDIARRCTRGRRHFEDALAVLRPSVSGRTLSAGSRWAPTIRHRRFEDADGVVEPRILGVTCPDASPPHGNLPRASLGGRALTSLSRWLWASVSGDTDRGLARRSCVTGFSNSPAHSEQSHS